MSVFQSEFITACSAEKEKDENKLAIHIVLWLKVHAESFTPVSLGGNEVDAGLPK